MRIQRHVIPEACISDITLQNAATWWIHCHDSRATCHIAGYNNSIRHIENRFSPYFIFIFCFILNAVWALTSGGFRIVSDTLVLLYVEWATCHISNSTARSVDKRHSAHINFIRCHARPTRLHWLCKDYVSDTICSEKSVFCFFSGTLVCYVCLMTQASVCLSVVCLWRCCHAMLYPDVWVFRHYFFTSLGTCAVCIKNLGKWPKSYMIYRSAPSSITLIDP